MKKFTSFLNNLSSSSNSKLFAMTIYLIFPILCSGSAIAATQLVLTKPTAPVTPVKIDSDSKVTIEVAKAQRYSLLAEQGDPEAQYKLGLMYMKGKGVAKNPVESVKLWQKAAEKGHPKAQFRLARSYEKGRGVAQNITEAIKWHQKSAEQGYAPAQRFLGMIYAAGYDVPQDNRLALEWLQKAAAQGDVKALYQLGEMYTTGQGIPQDYMKAAQWYQLASEKGFSNAQYKLGLMYTLGDGVPKDKIMGYVWLNLAAAQGNVPAAQFRDNLSKWMTPAQLTNAQQLSWTYFEKYKKPSKLPPPTDPIITPKPNPTLKK